MTWGRNAVIGWWLGALALSGCTTALQPMGPVRQPPTLLEDAVIAADGYRLPLRVWRPAGAVKAVVLAVHGFNDYANAYAEVGPVLALHGVLTCAYDQRGFGATPRPGVWPGTATMVADLEAVTGELLRHHPGVPLYVLGESMGGAVVMTALADPVPPTSPLARVAGVVLVAPAVWGRETMGLIPRLALALTYRVVPGLRLGVPRGVKIYPSDNIEMLRAYNRDPLVIKATRVDTINGLFDLMSAALNAAPRLTLPALILYGTHEQILPKGAIRRMLSALPKARWRLAVYPNGWHMLLRDRQGSVVIQDILAWIGDANAPLPSGADRLPLAPIAAP